MGLFRGFCAALPVGGLHGVIPRISARPSPRGDCMGSFLGFLRDPPEGDCMGSFLGFLRDPPRGRELHPRGETRKSQTGCDDGLRAGLLTRPPTGRSLAARRCALFSVWNAWHFLVWLGCVVRNLARLPPKRIGESPRGRRGRSACGRGGEQRRSRRCRAAKRERNQRNGSVERNVRERGVGAWPQYPFRAGGRRSRFRRPVAAARRFTRSIGGCVCSIFRDHAGRNRAMGENLTVGMDVRRGKGRDMPRHGGDASARCACSLGIQTKKMRSVLHAACEVPCA
jgi:hypothetical protein